MRRIIAIDEGNSSTKVTIFDNERVVAEAKYPTFSARILKELAREHGAAGCICSSVSRSAAEVASEMSDCDGMTVMVLDTDTPLPIEIHYGTRRTLGADRIAAAVGAHHLYGGRRMAVADAGTALTIDLVTEEGVFMGGNISPGVGMRLDSLHCYTAKLPSVCIQGPLPPYGEDTETALRCGAVYGAASEIEAFAHRCGAGMIVLTGGDNELLHDILRQQNTITVESCRHLVATGLRRIFEYNEAN